MSKIWHNDAFIYEGDFCLSLSDRALRGEGVFDTLPYNSASPYPYINDHQERLQRHGQVFGLTIPSGFSLEAVATELAQHNDLLEVDCCVQTLLTGGRAARGLQTPQDRAENLVVRISAYSPNAEPIRAIVSENFRRNEYSALSYIKSLNYGDNILAMQEAEAKGANEAIFLNTSDNVTCFTSGNLMIEKDGAFFTPPLSDGVMDGVTRHYILADGHAVEKSLSLSELYEADAIYLLNSMRGRVKIASLNGNPYS